MLKIIENGIKMPLKIPWRVKKKGFLDKGRRNCNSQGFFQGIFRTVK